MERLLIEPDADNDDTDDREDTGYGGADGADSDGVPDEEADEPDGDDVHADNDSAGAGARVPVAE